MKSIPAALSPSGLLERGTLILASKSAARRAMLDKSYAGRASATKKSDPFLIAFCVLLVGLLAWRGSEPVSFIAGLLVGMTLIQIYFHRYSATLTEAETPPAPVSPIKIMSYAIQAAPGRAWLELTIISALLAWSLSTVATWTAATPRGS